MQHRWDEATAKSIPGVAVSEEKLVLASIPDPYEASKCRVRSFDSLTSAKAAYDSSGRRRCCEIRRRGGGHAEEDVDEYLSS